ncbi:MAG: ABC transporter ATP-binding protein [Candidatus Bathyarchaeia archaeon]
MLILTDVHFSYSEELKVLRGVNLSLDRGESVAVMGQNGCGKTTLLMVAAGLLDPEKGHILLDGNVLKDQLPQARRRIGLVFQDPDDQLFNPTVYEEIAFAPRQILSPEEVKERVLEVADRLNLRSLLSRPPYKLSMGEKRMVTIASILAYDPELLLLDEPTANLSYTNIMEIKRILAEAKNKDKAVLVASHDIEFIAETMDRIYILYDGLLHGGLPVESILSNGDLLNLAGVNPQLVQAMKKYTRT